MTNRRLAIALIAALSALLIWLVWFWQPGGEAEAPAHRRLGLAEQPRGGDFTLESARGAVSLSDFRGEVVLLYFGYTWCPDICPTNLAIISLALKSLSPAERERVQVLFVSVDPERDDVGRLADFAAYFDPSILGLTGTDEAIAAAAARYGAAYRRSDAGDSAMGYMVDHSSYTYVVDTDGELAATLAHATPAERIVSEVRALLAER